MTSDGNVSPVDAVEAAIWHWPSLDDLIRFAISRHGYGNTDGGFGVTYASDLDDYDREVDGIHIPEGYVEVYGYWGPPDGYEVQIPEWLYRNLLAGHLERA